MGHQCCCRRHNSGRPKSYESWLALPGFGHGTGSAWGRGQPAAVWRSIRGAIMGQKSSTMFCCSPGWHYSSRGCPRCREPCSSDCTPLLSDAPPPRQWCKYVRMLRSIDNKTSQQSPPSPYRFWPKRQGVYLRKMPQPSPTMDHDALLDALLPERRRPQLDHAHCV